MAISAICAVQGINYEAKITGDTRAIFSKYLRDGVGYVPHRIVWEMFEECIAPTDNVELDLILYVAMRSGQGVTLA